MIVDIARIRYALDTALAKVLNTPIGLALVDTNTTLQGLLESTSLELEALNIDKLHADHDGDDL